MVTDGSHTSETASGCNVPEPKTHYRTSVPATGTNVLSWMISGWIATAEFGADGGGSTCLTLGCPADFWAVRLGFPNTTSRPWIISKAIGRASTTYNDYVNPTGNSEWVAFTFAAAGADTNIVTTAPNAPTAITVAGNQADLQTGLTEEPAWTWTDWAPIASATPDPESGMRVLMLRALIPSAQTVCFANSPLREITGRKALNQGFDIFIGGIKFNFDRVSDETSSVLENAEIWRENMLTTGNLFPVVQFLTDRPGIVGLTTGDSHHQGTSTTDQVTGYLYRAITSFGSRRIGSVPVGMANIAQGGLTSGQFFSRFNNLVRIIRPTFAVLPGWSFNDHTGAVSADSQAVAKFAARLIQTGELCRRVGVIPIYLTPFPRNPEVMSNIQVGPWRKMRELILQFEREGAIVLDASTVLGQLEDGVLTGTYRREMSLDNAHPNNEGHISVALVLLELLERLFGG